MKTLQTQLSLLLSLLILGPAAWADTVVSGEIDAGYQYRNVKGNEAKFEEYGEVPEGAVIPHLSADVLHDSDT